MWVSVVLELHYENVFGEASASFIGNKEVAQDKGSKLSPIWLNLKAGTMK